MDVRQLETIVTMIVGVIIIAVLFVTILFYIEHRLSKKKKNSLNEVNFVEGRYLRRFLPHALKQKYFIPTKRPSLEKESRISSLVWIMLLIIMIFGIVVTGLVQYLRIQLANKHVAFIEQKFDQIATPLVEVRK